MQGPTLSTSSSQRGYTLVIVFTVLAVLMVLGAAAIRIAGQESQTATAAHRAAALDACARSAREVMLSQLRFLQPIRGFDAQIVSHGGEDGFTIRPGHHPEIADPDWAIQDVQFVTEAALGSGRSPSLHPQITNDILPPGGASGSGARITAICTDAVGRTHEIEFLIRFGV